MTYEQIAAACARQGLAIVGAFHPGADDLPPVGCQTLVLLGPDEPGFWQRIKDSPEFGRPNPVDHWSERVIGELAASLSANAVFPFGGPPYEPFVRWALKTGRIWSSPVSLMVHDRMGLMLSMRGALAFGSRIALPDTVAVNPCETCADKPCQTACPVTALGPQGYDTAACHAYLEDDGRSSCLFAGCLVRRSCPVSQNYGRLAEQSAHHMRAFHKG